MSQNPEKEFDKVYTLSKRTRKDDEYVSFVKAAIEEAEDVIIYTEGTEDLRKLPINLLKGLFHVVKDRNLFSFDKGFNYSDIEYEDFAPLNSTKTRKSLLKHRKRRQKNSTSKTNKYHN